MAKFNNPKKWTGMKYPDSELVGLIMKYVRKDMKKGDIGIDIGCGPGRHVKLLEEVGFDSFGIDIDPLMIETCKNNGVKAIIGDLNSYTYEDEVKVVTSWGLNMVTPNVAINIAKNINPEYLIMDWRSKDDNSCYSFSENTIINKNTVLIKKENHVLDGLEYIFHNEDELEIEGYDLIYCQKLVKDNGKEKHGWYQTVHKRK